MIKRTKLTKEQLYKMFPHLKKEMEHEKYEVTERLESKHEGELRVKEERSRLESAVLIEGRKRGFPNPEEYISLGDYSTHVEETEVEFADKKGKVFRRLKQGCFRSFPASTGLSSESSFGDYTDDVLESIKRKPSFIIVKKNKSNKDLYGGAGYSQESRYNVEIYKIANHRTKRHA